MFKFLDKISSQKSILIIAFKGWSDAAEAATSAIDTIISNYDSISFGKQTWPHLLIRIMLMEQIYRAFEIIKGSNYHK